MATSAGSRVFMAFEFGRLEERGVVSGRSSAANASSWGRRGGHRGSQRAAMPIDRHLAARGFMVRFDFFSSHRRRIAMGNRNTPRSGIDAGPLIDVTVVGGAGHAGLPLALAFAGEGLRVLIYDINAEALDMLRRGRLPAVEIGAEPLLERGLAHGPLLFSGDVRDIPGSGAIIVTIG